MKRTTAVKMMERPAYPLHPLAGDATHCKTAPLACTGSTCDLGCKGKPRG